jgi:hypothetical protein
MTDEEPDMFSADFKVEQGGGAHDAVGGDNAAALSDNWDDHEGYYRTAPLSRSPKPAERS